MEGAGRLVGGLFNGVDTPPSGQVDLVDGGSGAVNRRSFVSRNGHRLDLLDQDGKTEGVTVESKGGKVSLERLRKLVPAIHAVLDEAIAAGGSTLRDYAQPDGALGYFSKNFAVYDREGAPCALPPDTRSV